MTTLGPSIGAVISVALASAFCRAGLNIIDRHQFGVLSLPVVSLNLLNNVAPAVFMVLLLSALGWSSLLMESLLDWRTVGFSLIAQVVALAFSHGLKHLRIPQAIVYGKVADLFIPFGILLSTGSWNWPNTLFAIATTIVCFPVLRNGATTQFGKARDNFRPGALIVAALVFQASCSPCLVDPAQVDHSISQLLSFSTAVIVWRAIWCVGFGIKGGWTGLLSAAGAMKHPLFTLRAALTLLTQTSFIVAVGSPFATVAWPILNATGLISMLMSATILREKPSATEFSVVAAIFALILVRLALP